MIPSYCSIAALTGIVQSISQPLATANISIFYLSTFETDFVFVPIQHVLLAVSVLRQRFAVQVEGYDEGALPAQEPPNASINTDVKRHPLCIGRGEYHLASLQKGANRSLFRFSCCLFGIIRIVGLGWILVIEAVVPPRR